MTRRAPGFSLIEMAFVLIIVTLLLGGLLVPFATQVEQKRIAETNKALEEIKEALIGYALSHSSAPAPPIQPHLPCPDTNNDGGEDRDMATGLCDDSEGNLPWATLGVGSQDAWGNRFHYRVSAAFSSSSAGFSLSSVSVGNDIINVCASNACPPNIASNVPAVVVSYGKNGFGARNSNNGGARNIAPQAANLDETANQAVAMGTAHLVFVTRPMVAPSNPCGGAGQALCEFDDQLIWLSSNVLFNRMVAAGRLP